MRLVWIIHLNLNINRYVNLFKREIDLMTLTGIQTYKKYFEAFIASVLLSLCAFSNTHAGNKIILAHINQETDITSKHPDTKSAKSTSPTPKPSSQSLEQLFAKPLTVGALRKEAIDIAIQLTNEFPNNPDSILLLGRVYRNQGNSTMAEKNLKECLKLNPNHAEAYNNIGWIAFQKAEYQKAIDLWYRVLEINPRLQGVYRFLPVCSR